MSRREKMPPTCSRCGWPLFPNKPGPTPEGMRRFGGKGMCGRCRYELLTEAKRGQPPPPEEPDRFEHNVAALVAFIREMRARRGFADGTLDGIEALKELEDDDNSSTYTNTTKAPDGGAFLRQDRQFEVWLSLALEAWGGGLRDLLKVGGNRRPVPSRPAGPPDPGDGGRPRVIRPCLEPVREESHPRIQQCAEQHAPRDWEHGCRYVMSVRSSTRHG